MTDREKCAELLAIVTELRGENHDIVYWLKGTFETRENITFKEFVDELMDEVESYQRGLWL